MATVAERNNNPGNLILDKIVYQGQTGIDSRGFAVFSSKEAGIRAADLNLQTYAKHGYDTIHKIIYGSTGKNGWSTTDQAAYESYIAGHLGISPNQPIDLTNPTVRQNVLANIFNFESGTNRYSSGALSDSWADIMAAAKSGDPLSVAANVGGTILSNTTNVLGDVLGSAGNVAGTITGAMGFDLGAWIEKQLTGTLKDYIIPLAIGGGAIILVLVSSWGLVKDSPVGQAAKSGAKMGARLAFI